MSQPSASYISKVVQWCQSGIDLPRIIPSLDRQFRARLALECYSLWLENKTISIRKIVKNIAARDYASLMAQAELGNEKAKEMVEALGIRRDPTTNVVTLRKETEISNDIFVVNQLVDRLSVAKNHIQKAMYEDNIEWLIQFGRKTGNVTAIREAQRNLEKLNNDFKEEENPADALRPGVERNITSDIAVIKKSRQNYSEEELKSFAKKIGASFEDVTDMIENEDGVYVSEEEDSDDDAIPAPSGFPAGVSGASSASSSSSSSSTSTTSPTTEPDTTDPFNS